MEQKNKLHGLSTLFDTPDQIIHAAEKVSGLGYKDFDVHTPYPVHGMDDAMKLKPSKLGYVTLVFGLLGATLALLLMWFTMASDYPMNIGGKPFFSLPAFIPVTFELTVLFATLATVFGMLSFFFRFPDNNHPLHDTVYMQSVSRDKYGLFIGVKDAMFNVTEVKALFESLGGYSTSEVFEVEKTIYDAFSKKYLMLLVTVAVVVSGTTYLALNKLLYINPFNWMEYQFRGTPQAKSDFFADTRVMRNSVDGTVARGHIPYEYKDSVNQPLVPVENPLIKSPEVLKLGQKKFLSFCSPCHGNYGESASRLNAQFPVPPSLHTAKLRGWKDGNIFHVITNGQRIMPSYAHQLTEKERWAIVTYVRALQKANNASEADIKEYRKESGLNGK
jgi:cytochrome c553